MDRRKIRNEKRVGSLCSIASAVPRHFLTQAKALEEAKKAYPGRADLKKLLERVFCSSGVEERHFCFPPEYYLEGKSFEERNRDYVVQASALAAAAARTCLANAKLSPEDVDHFFLVTTTGLATPSLDALLHPELGLRANVRRWPIFGLGCAGGAGALTRAADVLAGAPGQKALVVAVEVCGQVFTPRARTSTDMIGIALFGDGAAAVLVAGADVNGTGAKILATRSVLFEGTHHIMGWEFTSDGMRLNLSKDVPDLIKNDLRPAVADFFASADLRPDEITFWALHPGGRKIIDTYRETFDLSEDALRFTRRSLAKKGNLSSVSVLTVFEDVVETGHPKTGDIAFLCALGPGFGAELLLVEF